MAQDRRETSRSAGERVGEQAQQGIEQGTRTFAVLGERAFEAWMQNTGDTLSRVLEVDMELANWGREQLADNISAVRSLAQCHTVGDCYGVQIGLMRTSFEHSLRHASNLLDLTTRAMIGGMQSAQRTGSETTQPAQSGPAG
jgi:Phasin protein